MGETKKWKETNLPHDAHHSRHVTNQHPDKNDTKRQESKHDQYQNSATPHKDRHQHHKNDNEDTNQRQQNPTKPITTHQYPRLQEAHADTLLYPEKPKSNRTRAGNLTNDNKKWHIKKQNCELHYVWTTV